MMKELSKLSGVDGRHCVAFSVDALSWVLWMASQGEKVNRWEARWCRRMKVRERAHTAAAARCAGPALPVAQYGPPARDRARRGWLLMMELRRSKTVRARPTWRPGEGELIREKDQASIFSLPGDADNGDGACSVKGSSQLEKIMSGASYRDGKLSHDSNESKQDTRMTALRRTRCGFAVWPPAPSLPLELRALLRPQPEEEEAPASGRLATAVALGARTAAGSVGEEGSTSA
ncbi:hypothetical protein B0H19DRAFT_1067731 [Mycena capillaripes]|nr:hypothetical protein B0H19DRAFT_1067731 [Mycena capillaripes]